MDAAGNVVVRDVTAGKDIPPPGTRFLGSDMQHFMRFNGGTGMHKGYLPGYAASHGCVRMPAHMAEIFYNNVSSAHPSRCSIDPCRSCRSKSQSNDRTQRALLAR